MNDIKYLAQIPSEYQEAVFYLIQKHLLDFDPPLNQMRHVKDNYLETHRIEPKSKCVLPFDYFMSMMNYEFIVQFEDDVPVGIICFEPPSQHIDYKCIEFEIFLILVDKDHRNLGIAQHLLSFLHTHALLRLDGNFVMSLRLDENNDCAKHLFEDFGYQATQKTEAKPSGSKAIWYEKKLYKERYL